jgi:hypothetical protein
LAKAVSGRENSIATSADKKAAEAKKVVKITKPKPAKTTTTAKKPAKKA